MTLGPDFSAPGFYVAVRPAGSQHEERVDDRVISLSFEDEESKADKLTLSINNYDLTQFDSPLWQPGNVVVFQFGYPGAMSPVRRMKIQTVKGFNPLAVEALGDEVQLNRQPKVDKRWEKVKRSEVVREIAKQYGVPDEKIHIKDTELVLPQVTQASLTDLQLIRALAAREGYEFFIDFDGWHFHPQNLAQAPIRTFTYFTDRTIGEIESISTEDDRGPGKPGAFVAQGRNPLTKETFKVTGSDASTRDRTTLTSERTAVSASDIYDDDSRAAPPPPAAGPLGGVAQDQVGASTEATQEAAQRSVNGAFRQQQMRAVTLSLTCRGDAQLLAKSTIRIDGLGPSMSGIYYVVRVKHDLANGYKMAVKAKRDGKATAVAAGAFPKTTAPAKAKENPAAKAPDAEPPPPLKEVEARYVVDPVTKTMVLVPGGRDSGT